MTAHGLPTVTLGAGQMEIHTVDEKLDINAFYDSCRLALMLATGSAQAHS
jgi:tripeptide aminopeptidase